jgi:hypothetical protein
VTVVVRLLGIVDRAFLGEILSLLFLIGRFPRQDKRETLPGL